MPESILDVRLVDIEAPEGWNARSGAWIDDIADPTSDDGGYEGLKASMVAAKRNDEPVLLRNHPGRQSGDVPPYILVDGFRRFHVAQDLRWPTIRATVEELSEFEARRRNLAAQTGRIKHKPADLAWGIAEMKRLGGPELRHEDIGDMLGISRNYTGTLLRIMSRIDSRVTQAWRKSFVHVQINDLESLLKLPPEAHWKAWETLILNAQTSRPRSGLFTEHRLERAAKELGRTIGQLERLGFVERTLKELREALPLITTKELTTNQKEKLGTLISEGYAEEIGKEGT